MSIPRFARPALFVALGALAACAHDDGHAPAAARPADAPATSPAPTVPDATPATMPDTPDRRPDAAATPTTGAAGHQLATLANGCFWCTEAVLEQLDGVHDVVSGYMGGTVDQPTYQQVCGGATGHAECVQVTFDPAKISYAALLDWFFRSHDPTTLDRQGADVGTQYRSAIFFHSPEQKAEAVAAIARAQPRFRSPIVTEVTPASRFWRAEDYHQDYFRNNPNQGYCRAVIAPKLQKLGLDDTK